MHYSDDIANSISVILFPKGVMLWCRYFFTFVGLNGDIVALMLSIS